MRCVCKWHIAFFTTKSSTRRELWTRCQFLPAFLDWKSIIWIVALTSYFVVGCSLWLAPRKCQEGGTAMEKFTEEQQLTRCGLYFHPYYSIFWWVMILLAPRRSISLPDWQLTASALSINRKTSFCSGYSLMLLSCTLICSIVCPVRSQFSIVEHRGKQQANFQWSRQLCHIRLVCPLFHSFCHERDHTQRTEPGFCLLQCYSHSLLYQTGIWIQWS